MPPTGLHPREAPRPTSSDAEKRLWAALAKHLPAGWTAWHSLRVHAPRDRDGEGDFVIAVPDRGAIVLEVKGGRIEENDGRWTQNGHPLSPPPRDQAFSYIGVLRKQLRHRYPDLDQPFFAVATAFPDTEWDTEPSNGDVRGAVLGALDMDYLGDALVALVDRLFKPRPAPRGPWIEALHDLWGETWVPSVSLGSRTNHAERVRVALDARQAESIRSIDTNPRVFVSGPPGTGKTLLAAEVARRWTARGKTPVLLCFTRALAADLRAAGHAASTVRELAAEVLAKAGTVLEGDAPPAEWPAETWDAVPRLALEALPKAALSYDAVVVDEAQDLAGDDWAFVLALAGSGPLWTFGDEGQGFWADRREVPAEVRPFVVHLDDRYRCPPRLAAFADRYRRGATDDEPAAPFDELRVVVVPDGEVRAACDREVARLVREGVAPRQIAVLSLAGQSRTELGVADEIGGVPALRADDANAAQGLVAETFLRFKGLERPWIVVAELGRATSAYDVRMHIALTRATVGATVVASAEDVAKDARLAGAAGLATNAPAARLE